MLKKVVQTNKCDSKPSRLKKLRN